MQQDRVSGCLAHCLETVKAQSMAQRRTDDLMEGQTRMMETPEGTPLAAASLTRERMTVTAVGELVSRCHLEGLPWPSCQGRQKGMSRR